MQIFALIVARLNLNLNLIYPQPKIQLAYKFKTTPVMSIYFLIKNNSFLYLFGMFYNFL